MRYKRYVNIVVENALSCYPPIGVVTSGANQVPEAICAASGASPPTLRAIGLHLLAFVQATSLRQLTVISARGCAAVRDTITIPQALGYQQVASFFCR